MDKKIGCLEGENTLCFLDRTSSLEDDSLSLPTLHTKRRSIDVAYGLDGNCLTLMCSQLTVYAAKQGLSHGEVNPTVSRVAQI